MFNVDTNLVWSCFKQIESCFIDVKLLTTTSYVKNRFIGESGRSISDITGISDWFNIERLQVTMDLEKLFDSFDHDFLGSILRKFGFSKSFITWIEILFKDQLSCVENGGTTTQYFNIERGACKGDTTSAHLVILTLEILFLVIKKHPEKKV